MVERKINVPVDLVNLVDISFQVPRFACYQEEIFNDNVGIHIILGDSRRVFW